MVTLVNMSEALADIISARKRRRGISRDLRDAVGRAARDGLGQREIARRTGMSHPAVRKLLLASAAEDAQGAKRRWATAREGVEAVINELSAGDEDFAYKTVLVTVEHLKGLTETEDVEEWAVTPRRIPDPRFDALFTELARQSLERTEVHAAWALDAAPLTEKWIPAASTRIRRLSETCPVPELAALNIYINSESLQRA